MGEPASPAQLDSARLDSARLDAARLDTTQLESPLLESWRVENARFDSAPFGAAWGDGVRLQRARSPGACLDRTMIDISARRRARFEPSWIGNETSQKTTEKTCSATSRAPLQTPAFPVFMQFMKGLPGLR